MTPTYPPVELITLRHLAGLWWHRQPQVWRARVRRIALRAAALWACSALCNLVALTLAPLTLSLGTRMFVALALGPLSVLSVFAIALGFDARLALFVPAGVIALGALGLLMLGTLRASPQEAIRALITDRAWHHAQAQGWLDEPATLADALALPDDSGLPCAVAPLPDNTRVTLGSAADDEGHLLVAMMTGGGKGLHATATLGLHWPGAAIVVDPGGGILRQTYALRRTHPDGTPRPVYVVPQCDALDLGTLYDWHNPLDRTDLHRELIRPWRDSDGVFAEKSLFVFDAIATYAAHHALNPMDVLLGVAAAPGMDGLFELARVAPGAVADFAGDRADGLGPRELQSNRFAQSAWDTFKLRMRDYVPHRDTLVYPTIPPDWAERGGTLYITYGLEHLRAIGGLVSAGLAGLIKQHMARYNDRPVPLAIFCDELPALGLGRGGALATWTATVRRSGIRFVLYAQSRAQFAQVYPREADSILANIGTQVYGQPNEADTARTLATLFGTRLDLTYSGGQHASLSERELPRLSVGEIMNLGPTRVAVLTRDRTRAYRFVADRVDARERLAALPTITPPRLTLTERMAQLGLAASAPWCPPALAEDTGAIAAPSHVDASPAPRAGTRRVPRAAGTNFPI